ncbi:MAG: hypothetical protein NTW60_02150 [Candidatus Wolfebacteria bacterium]|nr:hypothetical protein [Candidatus Wolfebacteria bacterium]
MDYLKLYADFLKKSLEPRKPVKIVMDASNGATGMVLKKVFSKNKSVSPFYLNAKPDGNFPGHGPNPMILGATNQLQTEVKKQKADFGFIFDADGDRVFFTDNKGRMVNPDSIARLLVSYLKPVKIVINEPTGLLVRNIPKEMPGKKIIESRVGHYFMMKTMKETDSDFGAEHSAHYYFKKFFYRDAGILAAINVINAVSELPYPLSQFVDFLPVFYHIPETNFRVKNSEKLMKEIKKSYSSKALKTSNLDGLTFRFKNYWFNVRASNTEPLIRLNLETLSGKLLEEKTKELSDFISRPRL